MHNFEFQLDRWSHSSPKTWAFEPSHWIGKPPNPSKALFRLRSFSNHREFSDARQVIKVELKDHVHSALSRVPEEGGMGSWYHSPFALPLSARSLLGTTCVVGDLYQSLDSA
jgi:hypothetical protein